MKYLNWPVVDPPVTVLDYMSEYPSDDGVFAGLYGYNMTYTPCNFLGKQNRYYLFQSEFMA